MSKRLESSDYLPNTGTGLAEWFSEGVRHEIEALENEGGEQRHELISGKLCKEIGVSTGIYEFIIADATRIIEDSSGRLITLSEEYPASVVSQQANRIYVQIESQEHLPLNIAGATLVIDDIALLRRLLEVLDKRSLERDSLTSLAVLVFHPYEAKIVRTILPGLSSDILPDQKEAIEYACGSSVTYIWGPPGTGKTFVIAHLIHSLIESGERIFVCSHTNAAVNQALLESLDKVFKNSVLVGEGKIVRIGRVPDESNVPSEVQLEKIVEKRAASLTWELNKLEELQNHVVVQSQELEEKIKTRREINHIIQQKNKLIEALENGNSEETKLTQRFREAEVNVAECKDRLGRAMIAWFFRDFKCRRAQNALKNSEAILRKLKSDLFQQRKENRKLFEKVKIVEEVCEEKLVACADLPNEEVLLKAWTEVEKQLNQVKEEILDLQERISLIKNEIIDDATVIFGTLTKNYTENLFEGKRFDVVIIDEVSMALPPLVFLAAERATKRIVLVGDFMQLPPIVRSDTEVSNERLAKDTYQLAQIVRDNELVKKVKVLRKLETQRRMVPEIANISRNLVYTKAGNELIDHESVKSRVPITWLDFLPKEPIVIIDTADWHCWSGKQLGSLSRFNIGSATVSVRLAAEAAARFKNNPEKEPIGIVTPFAAQRRILSRLVREMELNDWVMVGTVHTFQGHEADLIIFDSVLDEPYYAARMCSKKGIENVKRELNVACTRAKNKFIFVGSSEWLNKCAKSPSGLGELWEYLKKKADLISVNEVLGAFNQNSQIHSLFDGIIGWKDPKSNKNYTILRLDESTFFDHFCEDIKKSKRSIFGLAPYFGQYRWPRIQPFLAEALGRGIEVTIVTPPISEVLNTSKSYVQAVVKNLRNLGAVVVSSTGLHGKDVIIDEEILYTGSLNWSSQRESIEVMHRINAPEYAKKCYEYLQVKHIRQAAVQEDGTPRVCPYCDSPIQVVNQRRQHSPWDFQAMKVGCTNTNCPGGGYLRNVDERPAFKEIPLCRVDGNTKYRCVRRGRGKGWVCPKHPKQCPTYKWIPGDPE